MHTANRMWAIVLAILLSVLTTGSWANARHPHGAWTGGQHYLVGRHACGLYTPNPWRHGFGWNGYRSWGYSTYFRGFYAPVKTCVVPSYYVPAASYFYYSPYAPICDFLPYVLPVSSYYVPTYVAPAACLTNAAVPGYNLSTVSTVSSSSQVPTQLLSAADTIFQAGGYRQAATAYAQLHVRYGSSDQIFGRRFVAQIACGDYDQAAVVLVSAQAAGFPIDRIATEGSEISLLFSGQPELIGGWTESLARYALEADDQRESLAMMATWLNLSGQTQRAGLFLAMVDRLSSEANNPTVDAPPILLSAEELPPPPGSKSALVSHTE